MMQKRIYRLLLCLSAGFCFVGCSPRGEPSVLLNPGWQYHKKADGRRIFEGTVTNRTDRLFRRVDVRFDLYTDNPLGTHIVTVENLGPRETRAFRDTIPWRVSGYQNSDRAEGKVIHIVEAAH